MFPSLGYADALTRAAQRGEAETRSALDIGSETVERAVTRAVDAGEVEIDDSRAGDGGVSYVASTDSEACIVKFAPEDTPSLVTGARVYERLADVEGVPVPTVHAVEAAPEDAPPHTVVEHVGGDEVTSIAEFGSLPADERRDIVRETGRVLGSLHGSTRFDSYGPLAAGPDGGLVVEEGADDWRTHYASRYESYAERGEDSPVADLAREAADFFRNRAPDANPEGGPVLLHGDFTPDNLVVSDGDVRAVLDAEHAAAGRPEREYWAFEANVIRLFEGKARAELRDAFRAGYGTPDATFRATKRLFAVGEFARIGAVRSVVADVSEEFDAAEFRRRAERELRERVRRAESAFDAD